ALPDPAGRIARLGGEHHLGTDVDREDVLRLESCSFGDLSALLEGGGLEPLDRPLICASVIRHRLPVPSGVRGEHLAVGVDGALRPLPCLLAVAAAAVPSVALDPNVWERHDTLAAISRQVVTHASGIARTWSTNPSSNSMRYGRPMICGCI